MVGDAISPVGVVVAGVVILPTGATIRDAVVSLLIGGFILWSRRSIIRETVGILLESTPPGVDLGALAREVEAVPGVANVHDLHVWSLSSGVRALSAHVAITHPAEASPAEIREVPAGVRAVPRERYGIAHTTLETHCPGETAADDAPCRGLSPERLSLDHQHGHAHARVQVHVHAD